MPTDYRAARQAMDRQVTAFRELRDAEVYALTEGGLTHAEIAARFGVKRQRVGQYVSAHRKRTEARNR